MTAAHAALVALATARLTRLITRDALPEHLVIRHLRKDAQVDAEGTPTNLSAYLVEAADCPFCIGFWIALGVLLGERLFGRNPLWRVLIGALALNYLTAHVSSRIDKKEG